MSFSYSQSFHTLIEEGNSVGKLIAGCGAGGGKLDSWEDRRQFIGEAFHKSGTLLDIGCGNGFLLRCLQEWSGFDLIPYGIDIDTERIGEAKHIFQTYPDHFLDYKLEALWDYWPTIFPETFDFIYCSLWGRRKFDTEEARMTLEMLWDKVSIYGRLILGFYGTNRFSPNSEEHIQERKNLIYMSQCVEQFGYQVSGKAFAEDKKNNLVIWIDKTETS